MFTPSILLFRGTGVIDTAIRFETRSEFTHAAIRVGPFSVVESYPGVGVRERTITQEELNTCAEFAVPGCDWTKALAFARGEIGCGYDWINVSRFMTRLRGRQSDRRWFCSEFVFAAVAAGGMILLANIEAWQVSPRDLSLSPIYRLFAPATARQKIYTPRSKKSFDKPVAT